MQHASAYRVRENYLPVVTSPLLAMLASNYVSPSSTLLTIICRRTETKCPTTLSRSGHPNKLFRRCLKLTRMPTRAVPSKSESSLHTVSRLHPRRCSFLAKIGGSQCSGPTKTITHLVTFFTRLPYIKSSQVER